MQTNKRLYVLFKAFTYDILFYYALEIMFLTMIKGFSLSRVFIVTSVDLLFVVLATYPLNYLLKKVSVLTKLRLGCISLIVYLISFIFVQDFILLCFVVIFKAVGYILLSVHTTSLLGIMCKNDNKNEVSKVEGRATAVWWVLEAISCIVSGYLFKVNPYIAYYISIGLIFVSLITSFFFKFNKEELYIAKKAESKRSNADNIKLTKAFSLVIIALAISVWAGVETFSGITKSMLQDFSQVQ